MFVIIIVIIIRHIPFVTEPSLRSVLEIMDRDFFDRFPRSGHRSMDRETEANKMFILWFPVLGTGQYKCSASDLTVIW